MNKPVRYWVRRAIVSLPLYLFFVHEADTRVYDNGERVFGDHHGAILWGVIFVLLWSAIDLTVSHRGTERKP
jgi:hypothetical protein